MARKYTVKNIGSFVLPDKNQRVFIVGADTYLGSHLAKYLLQNGEQVIGCGETPRLAPELTDVQYSATNYDGQWDCMPALDYDWILFCNDPREGRKNISKYWNRWSIIFNILTNKSIFAIPQHFRCAKRQTG